MVTLGARPQGLEHHRDYLSIGFPLRLRPRLSIHVHHGLDRGMTHEFLLDIHRCSGLVESRRLRVAERVPADVSELACCYFAHFVNDNLVAVRSAGSAPYLCQPREMVDRQSLDLRTKVAGRRHSRCTLSAWGSCANRGLEAARQLERGDFTVLFGARRFARRRGCEQTESRGC
jgi:hypothetical protein